MALKDEYFTISEAAKELQVTRQTISRWVAEGMLHAEKLGRETLIEKAEIEQYGFYRSLMPTTKQLVDDLAMRIQRKFSYTKKDKLEGVKFDQKMGMFLFSVTREDGNREIVSVHLGQPDVLDSRGKPFLLHGYKIPIKKITREKEKGK